MTSDIRLHVRDILIIGAGPAGLAAGIAAAKSGLDYLILEKGLLVNSIFNYPKNMVFFTTPELLEIGGIPFTSPFDKPTRSEALRYYRRVADTYALKIEFGEAVRAVEKLERPANGGSSFRVMTCTASGNEKVFSARTVILATGYYDNPNLLGIPGENLPHVSHYYTEPHGFYRKRVVVVGGENSAAEAALDLFRSGAQVTLVHRRNQLGESIKYWVRPDMENRIKEGSIVARFNTRLIEIRPVSVLLACSGGPEMLPAEGVFLLTGYHPDVDFLQRAGVRVHGDTCAPEHDPGTFETNVPGLYLAGAVVCGRDTGRVFIENGRFHGETVIKHIVAKLKPRR